MKILKNIAFTASLGVSILACEDLAMRPSVDNTGACEKLFNELTETNSAEIRNQLESLGCFREVPLRDNTVAVDPFDMDFSDMEVTDMGVDMELSDLGSDMNVAGMEMNIDMNVAGMEMDMETQVEPDMSAPIDMEVPQIFPDDETRTVFEDTIDFLDNALLCENEYVGFTPSGSYRRNIRSCKIALETVTNVEIVNDCPFDDIMDYLDFTASDITSCYRVTYPNQGTTTSFEYFALVDKVHTKQYIFGRIHTANLPDGVIRTVFVNRDDNRLYVRHQADGQLSVGGNSSNRALCDFEIE